MMEAAPNSRRIVRVEGGRPNAEGFYLRMGARRVGGVPADVEGTPRALPKLILDLVEHRNRRARVLSGGLRPAPGRPDETRDSSARSTVVVRA